MKNLICDKFKECSCDCYHKIDHEQNIYCTDMFCNLSNTKCTCAPTRKFKLIKIKNKLH